MTATACCVKIYIMCVCVSVDMSEETSSCGNFINERIMRGYIMSRPQQSIDCSSTRSGDGR